MLMEHIKRHLDAKEECNLPDEIMVVRHHFLDGVRQGNCNGERQPLRYGHDKYSHTNNEEAKKIGPHGARVGLVVDAVRLHT